MIFHGLKNTLILHFILNRIEFGLRHPALFKFIVSRAVK